MTVKRFTVGADAKLCYESSLVDFLVVEDNVQILAAPAELLEHIYAGCRVDKALHGDKAFELYKRYADSGYMYRVVFMDLMIPHVDGYETTLKIREWENRHEYPAKFICRVFGDSSKERACIEAQMNTFCKFYLVHKLPDQDLLKRLVESRLASH